MKPIPPLDHAAMQQAEARQSQLTKPVGALGMLEAVAVRIAGMTRDLQWRPQQPTVVVCAADHGVAAEGVSAYPQEVTHQMVLNFLRGGAAVNVLARQMGARVWVVDAGVKGRFEPHPQLIDAKISEGTCSFVHAPAMTPAQAQLALTHGQQIAERLIADGADILCIGEMGIGNTTSASAIIAALTGAPVEEVTGRGTGLNPAGLHHKQAVIRAALARHPHAVDAPLETLGGFEIGVMAGLMLGAAAQRVPVVIDGLICTAAALIAEHTAPSASNYMIASHCSAEPGHRVALDWLGLRPLLQLDLRLGEGTGALLALPLIEAAMRTMQEMATFGDAGVSTSDHA